MKISKTSFGNLGQWLASTLIIVGILIEISYGAHAGFIFITLGSLCFGIFTKIKYYKS